MDQLMVQCAQTFACFIVAAAPPLRHHGSLRLVSSVQPNQLPLCFLLDLDIHPPTDQGSTQFAI